MEENRKKTRKVFESDPVIVFLQKPHQRAINQSRRREEYFQ